MPRALLASLTLAPLLAACGGEEDHIFDITHAYCAPLIIEASDDASDAEKESVHHAVEMWNALGLTQLTTDTSIDAPRVPVHFREAALAFFGIYEDELGEVIINRKLSNERERSITVAHELGHVFGLSHVELEERLSVMNKANLKEAPNATDANALRALGVACDRKD